MKVYLGGINMDKFNSKESLKDYLLKNKVELTGFTDELDETELSYDEILANKEEYSITEHLIISSKEKDLIISFFGSIENFCKETNVDFVSEEITDNHIEFIHLSDVFKADSIKSKGLLACHCSDVVDLGFGIYAIESNDEIALDNLKTFFEDYMYDEVLVVKGKYNSSYTKCIYGEGCEGYIVLDEDVEPAKLSFKIMKVDDFLCL